MVIVDRLSRQVVGRMLSAGVALVGAYGSARTLTSPGPTAPKVGFADVQPILNAHCIRCHQADLASGGLALDSLAGLMKGGVSGKVVTPGNAGGSLLVERLLGQGGKPQMPMGFTALSEREIGLIRTWIDQGCSASKISSAHWAYVRPVRPPIPKVRNRAWIRNPIDAFVLSRLEREGLAPSAEADRTTLIRRVTLDLTGLPPTPKEVDDFLADRSPNAYDKVVDRLFASPHYGERMALPWLDAARYADSNGFQMDGDTYQYVWRDWVVRAMNANMPFDRFTTLQIAGDLLPNASPITTEGRAELIASAFNRNHMLNGEGGAIPEEARTVALFDRVDTTCTTWLGLTMTCARCHDHKYDPFTQRDYYSLMAYFNNVPETGIPEGGDRYSIAEPWMYAGSQDQIQKLAALEARLAVAAEDEKRVVATPQVTAAQERWEESLRDEGRGKKEESGGKKAQVVPKEILDIVHTEKAKRSSSDEEKVRDYFLEKVAACRAAEVHHRTATLKKQSDELRADMPRVMIMSDRRPRQTHIFSRGNYEAPLAKVGPATPSALPPAPAAAPRNRLGLAEWIVSPENPLTARVQVNRYWQIFFGHGLVKTPENFGVQGEPPTHPELLDWLAVEFEQSGWNVKRLQRMMVTSATYRQSSRVSRALVERDPANLLLARGARFRLPSMLIRDDALAASGLLNLAIGGKPVYPYQPKGIWDGLAITDERNFDYPQSKGRDLYRRSLYTFWRRTVAPGNLFDAASRQVCTVRQSQTSTPLHALTTLNDTTWVEAGRALAERVMKSDPTVDSRLSDAFRRACARRPAPDELRILKRSFNRALKAFRADPKAADLYLSQGESPRDKKLDPPEHAAYASVCLAILNLDEALTRE